MYSSDPVKQAVEILTPIRSLVLLPIYIPKKASISHCAARRLCLLFWIVYNQKNIAIQMEPVFQLLPNTIFISSRSPQLNRGIYQLLQITTE